MSRSGLGDMSQNRTTLKGNGPRRPPPLSVHSAASRLALLARIPARLSAARDERDLAGETFSSVRALWPHARRVALLRSNQAGTGFTKDSAQDGGQDLLRRVCSEMRILRSASRLQLPELMPHLIMPVLVGSERTPGRGPVVSVPIVHRTTLLGLLLVEGQPEAEDFTVPDLDEMSGIAAQIALVLLRLRAEVTATQRQRLDRDLDLAREIQRRFLPSLASQISGFRVAAEYRPAYHVGGDFYDLVSVGEDRAIAVIGDVAGKGVPAALLMSRVSHDFRRLARAGLSPREVLTQLNASLFEQSTDEAFVTAVCVSLDAARGRIEVCNAGHVAPLLRNEWGHVLSIGEATGTPLGMLRNENYGQDELPLQLGDIVLMMTDGVVEALDTDVDRLGSRALRELLSTAPADVGEINRRILGTVESTGVQTRPDDLTLLTVEAVGQARRAAA
jgi:serine phosphatase RsbU (regulator of sigma subunit)